MKLYFCALWIFSLVVVGCENSPPVISPLPPTTFVVAQRGEITVRAHDPDGDDLTFDWDMVNMNIKTRVTWATYDYEAVFSFTPLILDVGAHKLDFTVSDGLAVDIETVPVTIKAVTDTEGSPRFIKPLNTGATFYMSQGCVRIDILVDDIDSVAVNIFQQDPPIAGATLEVNGKAALFNWCPSPQQVQMVNHKLYLVADDAANPPVNFNNGQGFTITLQP